MTLTEYLEASRARLEPHLERLLPRESEPPVTLHKAMRYAVLGGGKRIRPILCLEAGTAISERLEGIEELACALEFIHTYSLLHDDLPALDNDDLRRGRPTCHKVFGEAAAILAGDALLTLAFEVLARLPRLAPEQKALLIAELATAISTRGGMIGGQMSDLEAEGKTVSAAEVEGIHRAKTGALIRAAIRSGARYAGASEPELEQLTRFGERLGLAFQIIDDILDVQSSPAQLGKSTRKDAARQKATYPGIFGLECSRALASQVIKEAIDELAPLGARARRLEEIARYLHARST